MTAIVFRTDASLTIGTGHVMRCLTLADALHDLGLRSRFVCRDHPGHMAEAIARRGYDVAMLPAPPHNSAPSDHRSWLGSDWRSDADQTRTALGGERCEWLVVDHYALDARWEAALRPSCERVMVIDDLADRPHDGDLLLDQNLDRTAKRYRPLMPPHARILAGPRYALLRPQFAALRDESLTRRRQPWLGHILITMGGVDLGNMTERVLDALDLCPLPAEARISVVLGERAPWVARVKQRVDRMRRRAQLFVSVSDMARLMTDSDVAIGAAGTTSWERCCLGLPTLQLILADNQIDVAKALNDAGAAWSITTETLDAALQAIFSEEPSVRKLLAMGQVAGRLVDGLGARRAARNLLEDFGAGS